MAIGTAGYTAMLCVQALEDAGLTPDKDAEVLVTGAAGGVGSVAVTLLAQKGYRVIAATGRPETHDYLKSLGAAGFVDRAELAQKGAPTAHDRWTAAVAWVAGPTLANVNNPVTYGSWVSPCLPAGRTPPPRTEI